MRQHPADKTSAPKCSAACNEHGFLTQRRPRIAGAMPQSIPTPISKAFCRSYRDRN